TERALLLDLWLDHLDKARVIATCWQPDEVGTILDRGVCPLVMLQASDARELRRQLASLPGEAIAYANPRYSRALLTPEHAAAGDLPHGIKLSKVNFAQIQQIRAVGGAGLTIIHGSSRNIRGSLS